MSTSSQGAPAPRSGPAAIATESDARRTVEDRYKPITTIGRGGMGKVEVALERNRDNPATYERIVALKRLLPDAMKDKRHTEMFLREARLAALLQHRNVVHAFSFGELSGELYLAMEYIEGEPLSRVVNVVSEQDGQLDPIVVAYILSEICDGLHAAHELRDTTGVVLNVVHRDVSPHNVMVSYDGYVKLLDFGVAKIDAEGLTKTGEVKGKVAYMSPEQAMGDPLDRRSDLYSIGACLFECLAGRKLWQGTDMEVLRHLALDEPPLLEDVVPSAPRELGDLYRRLVARDPKDRPATALHVAQALRKFIGSRGAHPDTSMLRDLMQRHFTVDAQRRREELSNALQDVAPSRVSLLRRSISPEGLMSFAPTSVEAALALAVAPSDDNLARTHDTARVRKRGSASSWIIGGMLGLLVVGAASGIWYLRGHAVGGERAVASPSAGSSGGVRTDSDSVSTPTATGSSGGTGAGAGSATAGATGSAGAAASGVHRTNKVESETRLTPTARPRKDPRTGTSAPKPKASASSKSVDVDPNPI